MCAELLTIKWADKGHLRSEEAALEDISPTGARLKLQDPIPVETEISLHYPKGKYLGKVKYCTFEETGYVFPVTFPWKQTLVLAGLAVGTATFAGLFPALHAVRLRIAEAIAYE